MAGAVTPTTSAMMTPVTAGQTTSATPTSSGTSMAGAATPTTPATPTGDVFNAAGTGFDISSGGVTASSVFIFATEDGTISGWNPTVNSGSSVLAVDNSQGGKGAVYKGLAIGQTSNGPMLYAANFRNGTVDVFNKDFQQVNSFTDPKVPAGFAPFNVQVLDNNLFVTFAKQDSAKHDDVAGSGNGFVDEFDLNGNLMQRVASGGPLDSPWGLAIAPSGFGQFANDLLVGNFGDGTIDAYNLKNDQFVGKLLDANGSPITIGDLWSLVPGSGSNAQKIYFTSGVQNEAHGLFGFLTATPGSSQSVQSMPSTLSNSTNPTVSGVLNGAHGLLGSLVTSLQSSQSVRSLLNSLTGTQPNTTSTPMAAVSGSQPSTTSSSSPTTAMTATQPTTTMTTMSSSQPSTTGSPSPMTAMTATQPNTMMTAMSTMSGSQSSILGSSNPTMTTAMSSALGPSLSSSSMHG